MFKKKFIIFLSVISMLLIFNSCKEDNSVDAVVVILGRRANAMAFSERYFEDGVRRFIADSVYGGYIGVVIGGGNPRVLEDFDFFTTDPTHTERARNMQIRRDTEIVLDFLKDERYHAETQENDLLDAIQEARSLLNVFEGRARRDGKTIRNRKIIIMDTGIATAGYMNFLTLGINRILFSELSDPELVDDSSRIAEILYRNRALPDLSGVDIVWIGLGDVADPQEVLSRSVRNGIEIVWRVVLEKSGAASIVIEDFPRGTRANEGFPFVTPVRFERWEIDSDQVNFIANSAEFLNQEEAELNLKDFSEEVIRHLNRRPGARIYVVGSIARTSLVRNYSTALSEMRAIAVKDTLAKLGVPAERMVAFGLGEFFPGAEVQFPNGVFDEEIARRFRKVALIPSDLTEQAREVLAARAELARRR